LYRYNGTVSHRSPSRSVVLADDDSSVRALVSSALRDRGYEVRAAADGVAVSELLGGASPPPDLLIGDLMMPTVEGLNLARLVRRRDELRAIPIIFLSARAHADAVIHAVELRVRHYVQKPFRLQELIDKVERLFATGDPARRSGTSR
jgi:two-component system phosphate regulon response regulator PhoB